MWTRAINVRRVSVAALVSSLFLIAGVMGNGPVGEVEAQTRSADYFLKIDGIPGESVVEGHEGEIEVLSWSFGASNQTSVGSSGMSAGKVKMNDFTVLAMSGKATPKLFEATAQGKVIPSATLTGSTDDGHTFITWELRNVIVSSFKVRHEGAGTPWMGDLRFAFGQILVTHTTQNSDGTTSVTKGSWDVIANKKV